MAGGHLEPQPGHPVQGLRGVPALHPEARPRGPGDRGEDPGPLPREARMTAQTWYTPAQPDHPSYLDHEALLAKVCERDFIDFPTGWAIQFAGLGHASERCSAVQSLAFLCDC